MADHQTASDIVNRAQALIDQVKQQLADGEQFYRDQGLDPEKVRSVLEGQMGDKQRNEADTAFRADMEAVEQETREEQARASFSAAPTGSTPRRPRSMI